MQRVVVTGFGALTPIGHDVPSFWAAAQSGLSGVGRITRFDTESHETKIAAELKDFDPEKWLDRKDLRRMDRFVQYALIAASEAAQMSGFPIAAHAEEVGVLIGCGIGGLGTIEEQYQVLSSKGPRRVTPAFVPMIIPDMAAGQVSIHLGAKGPNFCPVSACATGSHAIGEAFHLIRRGDAIAVLAGGTEAAITPLALAGFSAASTLSRRNETPEQASRPFDRDRDGFVMGEGAGVLFLESLDSAIAREATIYAEIVGYGLSSDAHHITAPAPQGEGLVRAMQMALKRAAIAPDAIAYINAHGTSTPLNDPTETEAIKAVFSRHANNLAVSSTKSMIGHLLGAAGAVEAITTILALRDQILPPTINLDNPDPACELDYVPHHSRPFTGDFAMSNNMGFGGHNASLIFRRWES